MIEARTVPQIVDLSSAEIGSMLKRVNFGHLGVCRNNRPYVVPIHFAYGKPDIYFYTTEGLKTDILDENPTVCLQVEDIQDREHWQSVIVVGTAERLETQREIHHAMKLIKAVNPKLAPAWSVRWLDGWIRSNVEVVYRVAPEIETGRRTVDTTERSIVQ
jgi:nitroimidazol reductase NimA-like FMN-containing flavoprotein (pyridoxamine 5'-phosphate oxidase superfamily)